MQAEESGDLGNRLQEAISSRFWSGLDPGPSPNRLTLPESGSKIPGPRNGRADRRICLISS